MLQTDNPDCQRQGSRQRVFSLLFRNPFSKTSLSGQPSVATESGMRTESVFEDAPLNLATTEHLSVDVGPPKIPSPSPANNLIRPSSSRSMSTIHPGYKELDRQRYATSSRLSIRQAYRKGGGFRRGSKTSSIPSFGSLSSIESDWRHSPNRGMHTEIKRASNESIQQQAHGLHSAFPSREHSKDRAGAESCHAANFQRLEHGQQRLRQYIGLQKGYCRC
jgi:hypothetical protein